ncbi:hypothetical protein [Alistipes sp.]|uniref:hypothetical protein n=1 Tax=Alistipes sp. TaxID=1872444 RepID=UPI003AF1D1C0
MEIEKVIRIVSLFLLLAAFALHVASRILFPESTHAFGLPISIVLLLCMANLLRETGKTTEKEDNSNR